MKQILNTLISSIFIYYLFSIRKTMLNYEWLECNSLLLSIYDTKLFRLSLKYSVYIHIVLYMKHRSQQCFSFILKFELLTFINKLMSTGKSLTR